MDVNSLIIFQGIADRVPIPLIDHKEHPTLWYENGKCKVHVETLLAIAAKILQQSHEEICVKRPPSAKGLD